MRLLAHLAAFMLLWTQVLSREFSPVYKRPLQYSSINDLSYLGRLSRRDECSDSYGDNAHNSICAPSKTRCCVRDSQDFPACEKQVGKGWCCVEEDGECYVDQKSVCNEDGSVPCTNLEEGTSEACCPKLTFCDPPTKASLDNVHCRIKRKDLLAAAKAQEDEESRTSSTSTPSSTSTVADDSMTSTATGTTTESESPTSELNSPTSATSSPDPSNPGLTKGAIAGVVVGAVAGGVAIASLAFWFLQRRKKKTDSQAPMQLTSYKYHAQNTKQQESHSPQEMDAQGGQGFMPQKPPAELES